MFKEKPKYKSIPAIPLRSVLKYRRLDNANTLLNLHKTYGPFVRFPMGSRLMVADPDVAQHLLLTNMDNYSKDLMDYRMLTLLMGSGLLTSEGKRWQAQRKAMQPLFSHQQLPNYFQLTQKAIDRFCEYWDEQAEQQIPVDMTLDMMALSMMMTAECLLQTSFSAQEAKRTVEKFFYQHAHVCKTGNLFSWVPTPANIRYHFAKQFTDKVTERIYQHNLNNPENNVISAMQGFSEDDQHDQIKTILATGHETTGLGLAWLWYLLSTSPHSEQQLLTEVQQGLSEPLAYERLSEFPYAQAAFQETIRLYPPIWAVPRVAKAEDFVKGYRIKPGAKCVINIYSLQRLPDLWEQADTFKPERFLKAHREKRHKYAYLPFGSGPHVCVANMLALMQAKMAIVLLAQRYQMRCVDPNLKPGVKTYVTLKPKERLSMRIQRRETL